MAPKLRIVSGGGPQDEGGRSSLWASALVFSVFLVLAPPLSAAIFFAAAALWSSVPFLTMISSEGIVRVLFFIYALGGLQAAAVGLVASIWHARTPTLPVPVPPVVTASMCAAVASCILIGFFGMRSGIWFLFVFAAHLVASMLCVLIANALLQRFWSRPPDGDDFRRRHER